MGDTDVAAGPAEPAQDGERRPWTNFGGNQTFEAVFRQPQNDEQVLALLARHRDDRIRAVGAGHSWSEVATGAGIALDMSGFAEVRAFVRDGRGFAEIGAGCRLADILERLRAAGDVTLPTLGAITRQTMSGAISTGTHGSGKPSLSHFVSAVRLATYDAAGQPVIVTCRDGDELKAARCALGCMGIVLSVEMPTIPRYLVENTVRRYATLDEVVAGMREQPLTQFILLPYAWTYVAWERRALEARSLTLVERLKVGFFRALNAAFVDVGFHLGIKAALWLGDSAVKGLLRIAPHFFITGVPHVDDSTHALTMAHHLFRHEEMELFVPEQRLAEAVELLRCATSVFAGETTSVPQAMETTLNLNKLYGALVRHTGTYVHHYPFFFRRILPEDTLISMASGTETYCSISVFTYLAPEERQPYYDFCAWLARAMNKLFGARLHWGKHFPLNAVDMARLYPNLDTFREICRKRDPNGVFRNEYCKRVLGL